MKLNKSTLAQIPISKPSYDRDEIGIGIVHFGVGGFHRAHQAMYIDRLLEKGLAGEWGICGVGVMPADRKMKEVLDAQDGLYTLVLENPDGSRDARVIGSIIDYRYAPDDPEAVIELLAAPTTRIVSLTITEGGYNVDNIDPGEVSVFGLVAEALARRRDRGIASPTIVSCDNIEGNGDVAREAFTTYAERVHPGLAEWIAHTHPVPQFDGGPHHAGHHARRHRRAEGRVRRGGPVAGGGRAVHLLGARGRFLRRQATVGGRRRAAGRRRHAVRADEAAAAQRQPPKPVLFRVSSGYRLVHDAAGDPLFAEFLMRYMDTEATPTLLPVPGIDLPDYKRTLIERFANPGVRDTIARLCFGSSDRIPKWLLPVIRANLASGGPVRLSAATVASWARYAEGVDEQGEPIDVQDQLADTLVPLARSQRDNPTAFIENTAVFGDLAASAGSSRPTCGPWNRCTAKARGRRWRP